MKRGLEPGVAPALKRSKSIIRPGTQCYAIYSGNGEWYPAVVIHADEENPGKIAYRVRYPEYGNEEDRTREEIMSKLEYAKFKDSKKNAKGTVILTTSERKQWADGMPTGEGQLSRTTLPTAQSEVKKAMLRASSQMVPEPPLSEMLDLGTTCWGQYTADNVWYPCEVNEIERFPEDKEHPFKYLVKYSGYGNTEKLARDRIRMNEPPEQLKQRMEAMMAQNTSQQNSSQAPAKASAEEAAGSGASDNAGTATSETGPENKSDEKVPEKADEKQGEEEAGEDVELEDDSLKGLSPGQYCLLHLPPPTGQCPCVILEHKKGADGVINQMVVKPLNAHNTRPFDAMVNNLKELQVLSDVKGLKKTDKVYVLLNDQNLMAEGVVFQPPKPDADSVMIMIPSLSQIKTMKPESLFRQKDTGDGIGGGLGMGGIATALATRAGFMANKNDPTKRKRNQDRGVIIRKLGGEEDLDLFGVLDGHGDDGHEASDYVLKNLEPIFTELVEKYTPDKFREDPVKMLETGIQKVVGVLKQVQANKKSGDKKQQPQFDVNTSGTTMCMTLRVGTMLFTANIGDSRAVLVRKSRKGKKSILNTLALTRDHKPTDPSERERIITSGGRCAKLGPNQPMRTLPRYADFPGLAITRTVGDFWGEGIGLAALPEIKLHVLTQEDLFIVWASDGIWEWMPNSTVARIINSNIGDLETASKDLVDKARGLWDRKTDGSYHDDITCVIARFD